jgi:hypothetical protein
MHNFLTFDKLDILGYQLSIHKQLSADSSGQFLNFFWSIII